MKTELTTNLFCFTFGHNYMRLKKTSPDSPELICKCCHKLFDDNEDFQIEPSAA
ncbi:MAG: hypothetical protein NWQ07_02570 [Flaviramulus sp.]|nr:hypothetical protein [Flaviramulus sp.]